MADVTEILEALETDGNTHKASELLPLVYQELHRLAAARLVQEKPGQTLQTTDLVHEAYVCLVGHGPVSFSGRAHFFGAAAEAMRRILIERARRRKTHKHGARMERVELATDVAQPSGQPDQDNELLDLDQALDELLDIYPRPMQIVVGIHDRVPLVQRHFRSIATPLDGLLMPCVFHQNASHGFGGRTEEMATTIPLDFLLAIRLFAYQSQVSSPPVGLEAVFTSLHQGFKCVAWSL